MTQTSGAQTKLSEIQAQALQAFELAKNSKELYEAKVQFLGKSGKLTEIMKEMATLSKEEKPLFGKQVNVVKDLLEKSYLEIETKLKAQEIDQKMIQEQLDLSLPGPRVHRGSPHPVSAVTNEIVNILSRLGYSLRQGPLIESDFNNFEALNIPPDHPARDMQDTFFVDEQHVLRTHTSPIQVHVYKSEPPPIRMLGTGAVFRCDSDISHLPHFHQIEGICVEENVSMADLKGTIRYFVSEFFQAETKVRFRPSFFPFTEPSAEVDCTCPICQGKGCALCKQSGWIEIGGCGLVNPKVFQACGLNEEKWQGFAFGFGIERMGMIKYRIPDIRLFPENDLRFLSLFRSLMG